MLKAVEKCSAASSLVRKCRRAAGGKLSMLGGGCTGREVCDVAEQAASL